MTDLCNWVLMHATYFDQPEFCENTAEDGEDYCMYHLEDQ